MQISRFLKIAGALAAVTVASLGTANAQLPIAPGTFSAVPPAVASSTAGSTLVSTTSGTFLGSNAGQTVTGSYVSEVYLNSGGTYDFLYQFSTGSGSTGPITQFSVSSFAGFTTAVGYDPADPDGAGPFIDGTEAPINVARTSNGVTVAFDFIEVNVGEFSEVMFIRTNATQFAQGNSTVQGPASANFTTFAPINPNAVAPEPGTMALVGVGMLGMAGVVARRRMKK